MTISGREFEISHGDQWLAISEVGANLRGYRVGDIDVTHLNDRDAIPPKSSGAVFLVPWPNRIAAGRYRFGGRDQQLALSDPLLGNASHGLGCWVRWTPLDIRADAITLMCDIVPQKGWPFELRAEVTYALGGDGLTVALAAANTGVDALPFGAGFHPYLSIGATELADAELTIPADRVYVVDDHQLPIDLIDVAGTDYDLRDGAPLGERRFDTGFTGLAGAGGRGVAELRTADRLTRLWWDAPAFNTLQVFTPPALADRPAIAIEPMTCPADAFNSGTGLIVLEPGSSWTAQWGIDRPAFA